MAKKTTKRTSKKTAGKAAGGSRARSGGGGKQTYKAGEATGKDLVIVESPAKARTINRYLGARYHVMASVGHVRDLPSKNPKGVKDPVPGVNIDDAAAPTRSRGARFSSPSTRHGPHNSIGIRIDP